MRRIWGWALWALIGISGCLGEDIDDAANDSDAASACEEGARLCLGGDAGICQGGVWIVEATCEGGCAEGRCLNCAPRCEGRVCGPDGCGGVCGVCLFGSDCVGGACVACGDGICGPSEDCGGCPSDCGCAADEACQAGRCVGLGCGDGRCDEGEGCGLCPADCGCGAGMSCVDGACRPRCGDGLCAEDESCASCPTDCGCAADQRCDPAGACAPICAPSCEGRVCGDDGCGGRCGVCPEGLGCDAVGQCTAPPAVCGDGACDPDEGCATCPADCGQCCGDGRCADNESCATCPADCACAAGSRCDVEAAACVPVCAPQCAGRDCGGDGCGGECGQCPWGAVCGAEGRCQATPAACGDAICDPDEDCATCEVDCGRCCGDGRCGGDETCAACPADCPCAEGLRCDAQANTCVSDCIPQCEGRACGDDGCEGECGACPDGFTCDNLGQCAPPPIRCGDGVCQASEGCATCAADCACAEGLRCDAGGDTCVPACVPACEGLACGPDGCGGDCGLCAGNDRCEGGRCVGGCEGGCVVGEVSCEPDGVSYRACVPAPESPQCGVLTRRVPCDEGRACGAEGCGGACSRPEILLVVDRSSSMEGARWAMVSDVIADFCDRYGEVARVQLRLFPSADACGAGPILPCDEVALSPPSAAGETPIAAALTDAGAAFGDPNEGEVVILITDGDETCADESAPLAPTRLLRARGAQVFTIGVSQLANGALLDAVAEAGGAGSARRVNDGAQLWSALLDIYEGLDGCDCAPSQSGEAACYQGEFLLCRGLDGQREPYFTAPEGTCACDPLAQQLRCVDQGLIRCGEAGWTFEGGQPGVQLCVDGEIGRCGEDANIPEGCAWMLESDEARCGDGIDNDGNGYADCAEWSCLHNPAVSACAEARAGLEITEALCTDGIDNDGNGYADCQDYHCARNLWINACGNDERDDIACADGLDNDLNGFIDCDDWDCSRSPTVSVCPSGCPAQLPEVRLGGWTPLVAAPEGGCRCQIGEQACRDGRVLECNHAGFWAWPGETARCVAEVEPNDTRGTAQAVAGLPAFMEGGCQGEDWLRFEVQAGVSYVISRAFAPGGTDFDAYLMLFDPQGVAINVDPDYPGDAFNVIYGWTAPTSGTYTLRVRCEPHLGATDYGLHLYPLR